MAGPKQHLRPRSFHGRPLSRRGFLAAGVSLPFLVRSSPAWAGQLGTVIAAELVELSKFVTAAGGRMGACFLDIETGIEVCGVNQSTPENPASNQKLVTAGAALRHLGGRFVFTTGLYGRVVEGNVPALVLRSNGDPSLTSADLQSMAGTLRERGVRSVGDLLLDHASFDERFVPPGYEQQPDEWAAFRAPVSAVAVDRNCVSVAIVPGARGEPARVSFEPLGFVDVEGEIETVAKGKRAVPLAGVVARGQRLLAKLSGSIAEGSEPFRYRQRVEDPRLLAGYSLRSALAAAGIGVAGSVRVGGAGERNELLIRPSRPLAELLPALGKDSDNFTAEMLLKALGAHVHGVPATSVAGADVATAWLREIGAWEAGTRVTNGSGLYDANRLTPRALTRLLASVWRDPALQADFVNQLAVGGVDGTLKNRFKKLAAARTLLAKTGTLRDVVTLSGYVTAPERGRPLAFACLIGEIAGKAGAARVRLDRMLERVAAELATERVNQPAVQPPLRGG